MAFKSSGHARIYFAGMFRTCPEGKTIVGRILHNALSRCSAASKGTFRWSV